MSKFIQIAPVKLAEDNSFVYTLFALDEEGNVWEQYRDNFWRPISMKRLENK